MTRRGKSGRNCFWQAIFMAFVLVFSGMAWAQDESDDSGDDTADLGKIAVTGSRIKRSEIEGPAPILVIDQQELSERGYTTVFEALQDLTINNGYMFEGPENINSFTPDVQTINLRGFGVGTTLTLINGRRLANYPAAYQATNTVFSYGSIPVAAIERIEILATGASAIYGSDAVSGVINIILRQDIDSTTIDALWGTPTGTKSTRGDTRLQLVTGQTFNRGSYTLTAEYLNRESILGKHYSRYDDQKEDYPYGTGVYNRTLLTLDWWKYYFTGGEYYRDPAEIFGESGEAACDMSGGDLQYAFRPGSGYYCTEPTNGVGAINFRNGKESFSAYFNGQLEIGDKGTELFTDILFYNANSQSYNNAIYFAEDIIDLTSQSSIPDILNFYGFPDIDWYNAQRRFTAAEIGRSLDIKYDEKAWTAVLGARGVIGETHDWEFSANYSKYKYSSTQPWLKWRETIDNLLGTWLGIAFAGDDAWSGGTLFEDLGYPVGIPEYFYGPANAALLEAIGDTTYGNETSDLFLQYTMSGDIMEMKSGPLQYALVVEYEDEELKFVPDALLLQSPPTTDVNGDPISGLTGSGWYRLTGYNGKGDRQRWSIGGELRIPVLSNLTLNVAGRYDHYDSTSTSIGGDFTPSASVEYRPLSNLLLRGGYTTIFSAPDLAASFVSTGVYTGGYDYVACQELYEFQNGTTDGFNPADCDPVSIFAQLVGPQTFGAEPLGAETGDSWWLGFSYDITDNLNVTLDYTNMTLDHRVNQQSIQGLLNDDYFCSIGEDPVSTPCDQVNQQIIRGYSETTMTSYIETFYFTNFNQYKEKGQYIDVNVTYNLLTEHGTFNFQANYDNVLKHTLQLEPGGTVYDLKNDPINGGWDPRSSFAGSVTWNYRNFSTTLTGIYRGATTVYNCSSGTNGCVSQETDENYYETENWWIDSYTTFNWTASYNWTDEFLTRIRIVNLFDEKPPKDDTMYFYDEPWYNPYVYAGAGIGRYAAIELEYTFPHK